MGQGSSLNDNMYRGYGATPRSTIDALNAMLRYRLNASTQCCTGDDDPNPSRNNQYWITVNIGNGYHRFFVRWESSCAMNGQVVYCAKLFIY